MPLFPPSQQPFYLKRSPIVPSKDAANIDELFQAVLDDDLAIIQKALSTHENLEETSSDNFTLLNYAAYLGRQNIVLALLEYGLNPAYIPKPKMDCPFAYNVLQAATVGGHANLVSYLLDKYPSVSINDVEPIFQQSILQLAILNRRFALAIAMLDLGELKPNLQHVDKRKRTALATALGVFVRPEFEKEIRHTEQMTYFLRLCLKLLNHENAFDEVNGARPAAHVLLHTDFASNSLSGHMTEQPSQQDVMRRIMLSAKKVKEVLLQHARMKSGREAAKEFVTLLTDCERNSQYQIHKAMLELGK